MWRRPPGDTSTISTPTTTRCIRPWRRRPPRTWTSAVRVAQAAFLANRHWLAADRERWFCKAAELVERDRQEFVDILVDEVGSPVFKAEFEVDYCIGACALRQVCRARCAAR